MAAITVEQALELARTYHRAGQLAAAEGIYRQVLTSAPGRADAWHLLGLAALASGRFAEALEFLTKAVVLSPANGIYHSDHGAACRFLGRTEEAMDSFRRALALQPDFPDAHNNLGETLAHLGRHPEAIAHFRRALELQPGYADAHNNLGMALAQSGQWDDAFRILRASPRARTGLCLHL